MRRTHLAVLGVLGAVCALASGPASGREGAPPLGSDADVVRAAALIDRLGARGIYAQGGDAWPQAVIFRFRQELPIVRCMAAKGFRYAPRPILSLRRPAVRPGEVRSPLDVGLVATPAQIERAGLGVGEEHAALVAAVRRAGLRRLPQGGEQPGWASLDAAGRAAWSRRIQRCQRRPRPALPVGLRLPPRAAAYTAALGNVRYGAVAGTGVSGGADAYRTCMARQGVEAGEPSEVLIQLQRAYRPLVIAAVAGDGRTDGPAWQALLARERVLAWADRDCRGAAARRRVAVLLPELERFERDHAEEIAELDAAWAARRAAAERLAQRIGVSRR